MIEILTADKLNEYGFDKEQINRLLTWPNHEAAFHNLPKGIYFASNIEQKIYSGNDAERKIYFKQSYEAYPNNPDLIPEYFERKKSRYLIDQRAKGGQLFNEKAAIERFIQSEIALANSTIKHRGKWVNFKGVLQKNEIITMYIDWLKSYKISSQEEILLSSLADDNQYFQSYLKDYYKKLKTASGFLTKVEFINEEIERVEKIFIQPSKMTIVSGGVKLAEFNVDKYTKLAYEWLKSGENWEIKTILNKAQNEYGEFKKKSSIKNSEIQEKLDNEQMEKDVITYLKVGVAYLKYQKFLKEQLALAREQLNIEKSLGSITGNKFIEIYNKEVTPERIKELEKKLSKIESPTERLEFLKEEKRRYLKFIKPEVLESSGTVSFQNFSAGTPLFFDRIIQIEIDKINGDKKVKTNQKIGIKDNFFDPLELITVPSLILEYESNISDKVIEWKAEKDKTGCAVFCNYLYQRKLFKPNKIVTAKKFAFNRYGNDINTMMDKIRKSKAKDDLEKRTIEIIRLILNKPFGKI